MSLATRCTACGTAFRVVQDQLKVSEGWVRCGRCSEVFNALEGLFDLERDGWPDTGGGTHPEAIADPDSSSGGSSANAFAPTARDPHLGDEGPAQDARPDDAGRTTLSEEPARAESPEVDDVAAGSSPEPGGGPDEPLGDDAPAYVLERPTDGERDVPLAHRFPEDDAEESPLEAPLADLGGVPSTGMDLPPFVSSGHGLLQQEALLPPAALRERDSVIGEHESAEAERTTSIGERIDARLFGKRRRARRHAPAPHVSARDQLDFSDARFDSDLLADDALEEGPAPTTLEGPPSETAPFEPSVTPEFVRRAEREARWRRPAMRAALGAAALALLAMLALQAGHHFHDDAAARWPALKPVLTAWCGLAGCTLDAPRHIDDISVESTALTRAPDDAFRLAVTLRSHGSVALALPWIDLTLTDAGGRLIARRALAARDLRPTAPLLQPGQEVSLQALVSARNARVTGYTVEIFYP
jgi:predicted Zn finger-like uncharacterized protein